MCNLYCEIINDTNHSIVAKNIGDAARQIAYRKAKEVYGLSAVIFDCNPLYETKEFAEYMCFMGKFDKPLKFTGHYYRFGIRLKICL